MWGGGSRRAMAAGTAVAGLAAARKPRRAPESTGRHAVPAASRRGAMEIGMEIS